MQKNSVSVLMSIYNEREEYIRAAIESILAQTYTDFEFIIINDNPDRALNTQILSEYQQKDARVSVITNERNMGLVETLNRGLKYVNGEYVARMDADDISHPDRLKKQLAYIKKTDCALVGCYTNYINEDGDIIVKGRAKGYSPEAVTAMLRFDDGIIHPIWLVKTRLYKELCGYRDIKAAEDYDFLLRAAANGYKLGLCNEVLFDCRINTAGISVQNALRQNITANYLISYYKKGRINEVSQSGIDSVIQKKVDGKSNTRFNKARALITNAASAGGLKAVLLIVRALFTSRYAWNCVWRMLMLRVTRVRYRESREYV